jgi:hypothetical protein
MTEPETPNTDYMIWNERMKGATNWESPSYPRLIRWRDCGDGTFQEVLEDEHGYIFYGMYVGYTTDTLTGKADNG